MAKNITILDTDTGTFIDWASKLNEVINAISAEVLTVDSSNTGATVTGNSFVYGYFGANTLVVSSALRGGNLESSAPLSIGSNVSVNSSFSISVGGTANLVINSTALAISNSTVAFSIKKPTAAQYSSGNYFLNANGSYTEFDVDFTANTTGTSPTLIDSFDLSVFRAGEYSFTITDDTSYQISKVMVIHDGSSAYQNEFGTLFTSYGLGTFSANANASHVRLYMTPSISSNTSLIYKRTLIST